VFISLLDGCVVSGVATGAAAIASRTQKRDPFHDSSLWSLGPGRLGQGRLNQLRPLDIDVRLQHRPTEPANPVENHVHVPLIVQHEQRRGAGLHHLLDLAHEVVADPDCRRQSGACAAQQRTDGGAGERRSEHQASDESHRRTAEDIGGGRQRLSVQGERSIGMSHDDRYVREDEVGLVPPEPDDLVLDLNRPVHAVVADGPEMTGSGRLSRLVHWEALA
jgi:hypothetical protein